MEVVETPLPGVKLIKPKVFGDHRGFFLETYQYERYSAAGIDVRFIQDNYSRSAKGILRGLHLQKTYAQDKLVTVTRGEVYDVAVDVRHGSPNFGQSYGVVLSEENRHQFFIPAGFAHGFCVLSDSADFSYKCSEYYHPEDELTILWNDPDLNIDWPIDSPILSAKDESGLLLKNISPDQLPKYSK